MYRKNELSQRLEKIKKVFNVNDVLKIKANKEYIQKYYQVNKIPYSLLHTQSDFIYMGISRDGTYKEEDLLEPPKMVARYIKNNAEAKVLELATGRGAASQYLAKIFPKARFYGIDLSKGQLGYAYKKASKVKNYFPKLGDYHDLREFHNEMFDVVFIIEALCYSHQKEKVVAEVYRVLKKQGVFIIFDGYLNKSKAALNSDEKIALGLTEKGMALERFEPYKGLKHTLQRTGFICKYEEDVSQYTLPTMRRFERLSKIYFNSPKLAKIVALFFPKEFLYNAISGYLGPLLVEGGLCSYMITVVQKPYR